MNNMDILKNNGINVDKSLAILGDISLYNDAIVSFISESDNKLRSLIQFKQANNMVNYEVLIQSVKSDANYLGFDKLAILLNQQEEALKNNDLNFINQGFEELIKEYNRVVFVCKQYNGISSEIKTKEKILVVDDSSIIRNFVTKIFSEQYVVLTASDGNEAIENIKNNKDILCVLLDLNMPTVNGFEVLEYFKTNNLFKDIPVSLLTGDDTKDSIDRAFKYPIVDMVSKPFNESDVRAIVDKIIFIHNFN